MTINDFNRYGAELEKMLLMRDAAVAVKVLNEGEAVPEDLYSPYEKTGKHYAMCQAFSLVRRARKSIVMYKEDNWCLWPLISYGITEIDDSDYEMLGGNHFYKDREVSHKYFRKEYPRLNSDRKAVGFAMAPLSECTFVPDIVCIYCSVAQLRTLLMASKYESGEIATSSLDTCASCVHGQIPVLNGTLPYNLSIPDPGEYERGLCDENEMIFNVSGDRVEELVTGLTSLENIGFGYGKLMPDMNLDYSRPEFYNFMFEKWGLPRGAVWNPGARD